VRGKGGEGKKKRTGTAHFRSHQIKPSGVCATAYWGKKEQKNHAVGHIVVLRVAGSSQGPIGEKEENGASEGNTFDVGSHHEIKSLPHFLTKS